MTDSIIITEVEVDLVVLDLAEWFEELDDSGEGVFGERARVELNNEHPGLLIVRHEDAQAGMRITVEPL